MDLKKIKIEVLRELCKKNNLPDHGKKEDLIKRLSDLEKRQTDQLSFGSNEGANKKIEAEKNETLFIQLKASNLPYYFNHGVVYPLALEESEIYKNENRKKDILTQFDEYILLSNKPINTWHEDDVLVEVIIKNLLLIEIKGTRLRYSAEPIPISRIKNIAFLTAGARSTFLSSVKTFPDSFIHDQLCSVITVNVEPQTIDLGKINLPLNGPLQEWKVRLQKFDRIMGMFSFMKNAGIFFAEKDNTYQEYTPNYFYALSLINPTIKEPELVKDKGLYRYILFPNEMEESNIQRVLFRQILGSINNNIDFDLKHAEEIINKALSSQSVTNEESKELNFFLTSFRKLSSHEVSYKDLLSDESIRKNYPILALLFLSKFPNKSRQHTDKQAVRNTFILHETQLSKSVTEFLLGMLGLYYGYKRMIKQDTNLKTSDTFFATLSDQQQSIKFRLLSHLDRITIESIFNFCKLDRATSDDYAFLNLAASNNQRSATPSKWGAFAYQDKSYEICDTKITIVERKNKADKILDMIDRGYPDGINSKSLLAHYVISNLGISKKMLLDTIKSNTSKLNIEELSQVIELDQHHKNNK